MILTYKTEGGPNWTVTLALSVDGQLHDVRLDCDGRPYATVPVGREFPPNTVGAYLGTYPETTCSKGVVELTVVTLPKGSMIDIPGMFIPAVFYFAGSVSAGPNVGKLEDIPRVQLEKYCPKK